MIWLKIVNNTGVAKTFGKAYLKYVLTGEAKQTKVKIQDGNK